MPHFTTGNKRMTNVSVGNGEYVSGIRKNENLGKEELMMSAGKNWLKLLQWCIAVHLTRFQVASSSSQWTFHMSDLSGISKFKTNNRCDIVLQRVLLLQIHSGSQVRRSLGEPQAFQGPEKRSHSGKKKFLLTFWKTNLLVLKICRLHFTYVISSDLPK